MLLLGSQRYGFLEVREFSSGASVSSALVNWELSHRNYIVSFG